MSTTFGTLASTLTTPLIPTTRHRHTAENDQKTAAIKRINRLYARKDCNRVVRTGRDGVTRLYEKSSGQLREFFGVVDVVYLESMLRY